MEIPKLKRSLVAPAIPYSSINPTAFLPVGNEIDLMALTTTTCRWPVDTSKGIMFCGSVSEGIYCCTHSAMSKGKGTYSERDSIRAALKRDDLERRGELPVKDHEGA